MPFLSRRELLLSGLWSAGSIAACGCGTILHPERRGQPAGPLDWKIVALNAVGLLFFFVPGVIAFAVDFSNGTIYLPTERYDTADAGERPPELRQVRLPTAELSLSQIEAAVSAEIGDDVRLRPDEYETRELRTIDEFWDAQRSLASA